MASSYNIVYAFKSHRRDPLIEFIKSLLRTPFVMNLRAAAPRRLEHYLSVMRCLEQLVDEHMTLYSREKQQHRDEQTSTALQRSQLSELCPGIGEFFTPLRLCDALLRYDAEASMTQRRHVAPSFNDVRHILNTAQILALLPTLKLVTFDGDMTLYADGGNLHRESPIVSEIVTLLRDYHMNVAVVTAAGYPHQPERYEQRLAGLLEALRDAGLHQDEEVLARLFVLGGECSYLFSTVSGARFHTEPQSRLGHDTEWHPDAVRKILDAAEECMKNCIHRLRLSMTVIRKPRAVGMVRAATNESCGEICCGSSIRRENLDEVTISVKCALDELDLGVAFCAFNGGSDVWVDIGNKSLGVRAVQSVVGCGPHETLHFGDQFLSTGNDVAARRACCTAWVADPTETVGALIELREALQSAKQQQK